MSSFSNDVLDSLVKVKTDLLSKGQFNKVVQDCVLINKKIGQNILFNELIINPSIIKIAQFFVKILELLFFR